MKIDLNELTNQVSESSQIKKMAKTQKIQYDPAYPNKWNAAFIVYCEEFMEDVPLSITIEINDDEYFTFSMDSTHSSCKDKKVPLKFLPGFIERLVLEVAEPWRTA